MFSSPRMSQFWSNLLTVLSGTTLVSLRLTKTPDRIVSITVLVVLGSIHFCLNFPQSALKLLMAVMSGAEGDDCVCVFCGAEDEVDGSSLDDSIRVCSYPRVF